MKIQFLMGMGQMLVEGGEAIRNLARAEKMIKRASRKGCRIVVLPECMDLGWTFPDAKSLAQPIPGKYSEILKRLAQENDIFIVAGLTEKCDDTLYNAAVLISPEGNILLKHRKINELEIAQNIYTTGDSLSVVKTPLGIIGIDICADNFPDSLVLGHALARMGVQIILSPSSWAVKPDHDNNRSPYGGMWKDAYNKLASLYDISIVGVSNVGLIKSGVWNGRRCIGCSLAVGPGGKILAQGSYGENAEELLVVNIDIIENNIRGTALTEMLKKRGYEGQ